MEWFKDAKKLAYDFATSRRLKMHLNDATYTRLKKLQEMIEAKSVTDVFASGAYLLEALANAKEVHAKGLKLRIHEHNGTIHELDLQEIIRKQQGDNIINFPITPRPRKK